MTSESAEDEYAPYAAMLPLSDLMQRLFQRRLRHEVLARLRRSGARSVIDIGGGTGNLAAMLARKGIAATCLDSSPTMLARARKRASKVDSLKALEGDAAALPFDSNRFDAAHTALMLHEMDEETRGRVWREMQRVVRPRGVILIFDFRRRERDGIFSRLGERMIARAERKIGQTHPAHYENYKHWMAHGGLAGFLERRGAAAAARRDFVFGNIGLVTVENSAPEADNV